jgi:hypothetical protein
MNTNKHTPGPWGLGLGNDECQDICTEQGEHICTVAYYPIKENAALISAAPELLAACTDAERVINGPIAELLTGDSMSDTGAYEALRLLQEAIRKARGEV